MSAYQHIAQLTSHIPVRQLCQVLRVAPAAYLCGSAANKRHRSSRLGKWPYAKLLAGTASVWHASAARRSTAEGHVVGRWRIRRVLEAHGLRAQ